MAATPNASVAEWSVPILVPIGSNKSGFLRAVFASKMSGFRKITSDDLGPEKAGVGGSIPSLATTPTLTKHDSYTSVSLVHTSPTASLEHKWSTNYFSQSAARDSDGRKGNARNITPPQNRPRDARQWPRPHLVSPET